MKIKHILIALIVIGMFVPMVSAKQKSTSDIASEFRKAHPKNQNINLLLNFLEKKGYNKPGLLFKVWRVVKVPKTDPTKVTGKKRSQAVNRIKEARNKLLERVKQKKVDETKGPRSSENYIAQRTFTRTRAQQRLEKNNPTAVRNYDQSNGWQRMRRR